MDLQKIWNDSEASTEKLPEINHIAQIKSNGLKNPLKRAKKTILTNLIWTIIIGLIYIPIIYYYRFWQIQLFIGITLIFNIWAGYTAFILYKSIDSNVSANNLLSELKRVVNTLNKWMNIQCKVALFIYPFSATGGYFLGGVIGSGKTVEELLTKPIIIYALIVCIVVLTPASYYLAKWMFKCSFGKVITQINVLIAELTQVEKGNV
ncbi:hypothetical protein A5893_00280 [Pedobacter psychrophilus]|uniref:Uncharacterized protein n=1 Tax=Pedobacter psychrophilus TaxID=1826909 RepID=A0A179DM39_9SPHI|nr:hypothetical protein [Pedobacter psychrophilus]OAQ41589.1 hypothetical protein A5893_00280 [Pedobacter psychrophilus]